MKAALIALTIALTNNFNVAFSQSGADAMITEIEARKKFNVSSSSAAELQSMSNATRDTAIRVLKLTSFSRKKDGLGKVVQRSRYQGTEVTRTCYFNTKAKLFAIRDSVWYDNHTTRQLTYYFNNGKLENAIDSKNKNVTGNINQAELFSWISDMFEGIVIE